MASCGWGKGDINRTWPTLPFLTLLGHRAVASEMRDGTSEYQLQFTRFSDVPHGASPNVMRYGGNPSSNGAGGLQIRGR